MTPAEAVGVNCRELATLAPLLGPALRRDQTGSGRYGRLEHLSLFNTDVLLARNRLVYEIPAAGPPRLVPQPPPPPHPGPHMTPTTAVQYIGQLEDILAERERTITSLENENTALRAEIDRLHHHVTDLKGQLAVAKAQAAAADIIRDILWPVDPA